MCFVCYHWIFLYCFTYSSVTVSLSTWCHEDSRTTQFLPGTSVVFQFSNEIMDYYLSRYLMNGWSSNYFFYYWYGKYGYDMEDSYNVWKHIFNFYLKIHVETFCSENKLVSKDLIRKISSNTCVMNFSGYWFILAGIHTYYNKQGSFRHDDIKNRFKFITKSLETFAICQ